MFSKLCQIYVTYHNWTFFSYRDFSNFWHRNYFECFTPQYFGIAHRFEHAIVFEIWTLNFLYHVITIGFVARRNGMRIHCPKRVVIFDSSFRTHQSYTRVSRTTDHSQSTSAYSESAPLQISIKMLKNGESEKINQI